jgi:hypothetical protein
MKIIRLILVVCVFFNITIASSIEVDNIARSNLESNIIHLPQGDFLAAGSHQFGSLWTRDFCFSVPGLLILGKSNLVKNQLNFLINNRRADGLVPIYADSISPMIRVVLSSLNKTIGTHLEIKLTDNIKPFYQAVGKFPTIDANVLVLKASYEYFQSTHDQEWWDEHQEDFYEIYHYYDKFIDDGLIVQGAFSDWQDSARREGKVFFTNLLYLEVSKNFQFKSDLEINELKKQIQNVFYDTNSGLYFSVAGHGYISLDGVLWAIDKDLLGNSLELYLNLKRDPLWNRFGYPGPATFPSYPKNWIAKHNLISGLSEYHGKLAWSWLIALSAKVAKKMNDHDEALRIHRFLENLVLRDKTVNEIYNPEKKFEAFRSPFYFSENPFSWGAAFILESNRFFE